MSEFKKIAGGILLKDRKMDIRAVKLLEHIGERPPRQRRGIAFGRDMSKQKRLQAQGIGLAHKRRRILVGEMPRAAADALFERYRTVALFKQDRIVVGFKHRTCCAGERHAHVRGHDSHIRTDEKRTAVRLEKIPHRIGGVVRDRERRHRNVSKLERFAVLEKRPSVIYSRLPRDSVSGIAVRHKRNIRKTLVERRDTLAVIRMVVCEKDGCNLPDVDPAIRKPFLLLLEGKPEIDKQERITRTDGNGIAARTAS